MQSNRDSRWWKTARRRRLTRHARTQVKSQSSIALPFLLALLVGTGGICIFLILWVSGRNPNEGHHPSVRVASPVLTANDPPLIHIVHTRFMQHQGNLTILGHARLALFETFCLPTMLHQTNQNFLWIIKTDPNLHDDIRIAMIDSLKTHSNFFLVGSLTNHLADETPGSWRGGEEGSLLLDIHPPIYTGDISLLKRAHALRNVLPVLESRLDADDGLHVAFIDEVQRDALREFSSSASFLSKAWMYWCAKRHVEWYAVSNTEEGVLKPPWGYKHFCITPGLTVGYNVGTKDVPKYPHDVLFKSVLKDGGCGGVDTPEVCVRFIDRVQIGAIRSRTPTSAGMMNAIWEGEIPPKQDMWKLFPKLFQISRQSATETNHFIQSNLVAIAKENLEGQCTKGHSCKNKTVVTLTKLMKNSNQPEEVVEMP